MKIGYRRVSSLHQHLDRQDLGPLDKTFEEKLSGATAKDRPELQNMIEFAREGDEIIVWSIDRMARDLRGLCKRSSRAFWIRMSVSPSCQKT